MKKRFQKLSRVCMGMTFKSHTFVLVALFSFYLKAETKPNIILILADDHGTSDLAFLGLEKDVKSPALDRLAEEGTYYEQAYSTAPICNASRAALMSGIYQARLGVFWYANPGLQNLRTPSLAQSLKNSGYRTAYVGKVHYGSGNPDSTDFPLNHGFDEFFGFCGGRKHYLFHDDLEENHFLKQQKEAGQDSSNPVTREGGLSKFESLKKGSLWRNRKKVVVPGFSTEIFGREARDFIKRQYKNPFYLHLSFNAVHNFTHQLPKKYLEEHNLNAIKDWDPSKEAYLDWYRKGRYPNNPQGREYYLAHIDFMDREIAKVMNLLDELKIKENTLLIYASDNGGSTPIYARNGALRGSKYTLYEGGVRVPLIISGPGFSSKKQISRPVSLLDLYPTICDLVQVPKGDYLDGKSLYDSKEENRIFYWDSGHERAIRKGKWKYKQALDNADAKLEMVELEIGEFLYDLESDPGERVNLLANHPEKVLELKEEFRQWKENLSTKKN
ncbi:sulfatase-like hydrolase/transferase [Lentisphaera marina]|uniref:sulfatase family protein n=1 Tax=Lentisphaera marina TaxID=1111041 RepID=UPI0023666772|nr:sulfatase-like hydrolase/transferase [Lentisphaera marina]MDD7987458.1 sulfatase-like hydrolase/transferase [Lentisphaera marina]